MLTMKLKSKLLVVILVLIPILVSGQETTKVVSKGLTVSVQSAQTDILVPFFLSGKFILAPVFQFVQASDVGFDISFGLFAKRFFIDNRNVRPYCGLKAGLGYFNPSSSGASSQTDFAVGGAVGVEYFFNPNFSLGIEPQLNFYFSDDESDRFGNPGGTGINTATALTMSIYF